MTKCKANTKLEIVYSPGGVEEWLTETFGEDLEQFFEEALRTVGDALKKRGVESYAYPSLKLSLHPPAHRNKDASSGICASNKRLIVLWIGDEFMVTLFHELIHWFSDNEKTSELTSKEKRKREKWTERLAWEIFEELVDKEVKNDHKG